MSHRLPTSWAVPSFKTTELKKKTHQYCLVIPVINEGQKILSELQDMKQLQIDRQLDIIMADGGSTDGSMSLTQLKKYGVTTLLTKTGPGKLSAQLRMGYAYALAQGYEGIVTIDGNNKDGVEAIPNFVTELEKGYDFVQGSRFVTGGKAIRTPLLRLLAIRLIHTPLLSIAAGFWFTDTTNGYRAYSKKYLLHPQVQPFRDIFLSYELLVYLSIRAPQLGLKTEEIPVTRQYPETGQVPTKIAGWKGYIGLLQSVLGCYTGKYNLPVDHA